jgi:multidrug transporter EmrE-like cation transporter
MRLPAGEAAGREWLWGAIVGLFNIAGTHGMVSALSLLPAAVAFPLNTIAGIALTSLLAVFLFKERLGPAAVVGLVLAAAAGSLIRM